jgi:hypothetical protein
VSIKTSKTFFLHLHHFQQQQIKIINAPKIKYRKLILPKQQKLTAFMNNKASSFLNPFLLA